MTEQLDLFAEQHATVAAVADHEDDYARFLRLCEIVALSHDRRVTVNAVRRLAESVGFDMDARRYSACWQRATAKGGPMVNTDEWEASESTKTGRNGGKPQRVRRWVA